MQNVFQSHREDHSTSDGHLMDSLLVNSTIITSLFLPIGSIYFSHIAKTTQPQMVILWTHIRSIRPSLHLSSLVCAVSISVVSGGLLNLGRSHLMDSLLVHSYQPNLFSSSLIEVCLGRYQTPLIEANLGLGNPPVIWIDGMGGYLGPYRASDKRPAIARSRALSASISL